MAPNERKSLSAAGISQRETGAAILIHPGRHPDAPVEILELLANSGADTSRVIMGHLDRTVFEFDALRNIAASGCYLEWDLFGNEGSYYPLAEIDMPSDAQRLEFVRRVAEAGYADRIVIGQDIFTKHRLIRYGGHGYGHILENIVPKMRRTGFSEDSIRAITVGKPGQDTRICIGPTVIVSAQETAPDAVRAGVRASRVTGDQPQIFSRGCWWAHSPILTSNRVVPTVKTGPLAKTRT